MTPATSLRILRANLADEKQCQAIVDLLDHYARDPMGGCKPLSCEVREALIPRLRAQPGCRAFLAFENDAPLGLAICFTGFSTFQAQPLLNIHDVAVHASARGRGVGRALLSAIETEARAMGCCKLTLEVRADNHNARHLYESFGFDPGQPETSAMSFLTKKL